MATEGIIQDGPYAGQPGILFSNWDDLMDYAYLYGMPDSQLCVFQDGGGWNPMNDDVEYHGLVPGASWEQPELSSISLTEPAPVQGIVVLLTRFAQALIRFKNMLVKSFRWIGQATMRKILVAGVYVTGAAVILSKVTGLLYPQSEWYVDEATGISCIVTGGRVCCINPETNELECEGEPSPLLPDGWEMYAAIGLVAILAIVLISKR